MNMKTDNIIEGIQILDKYRSEKTRGGYNIGAWHDTIALYHTTDPLLDEDVKRMAELGFFQSRDDVEIPEDDEWSEKYYDVDASWQAFV